MHVGIVGFGKMGQSVWQLMRRLPHRVSVVVRTEEKARQHRDQFVKKTDRALRRAGIPEAERAQQLAQAENTYRFTHRLDALRDADVVLENITEDVEAKIRLFAELESVLGDGNSLLLTNTSSISVEDMAKALRYPERFCGLHFFHPTAMIPLVEIIVSPTTSSRTLETVLSLARDLERVPVVVSDGPGSVINGILVHYYAEAVYMLEEGEASPHRIDSAAREFFYVGPLESVDVIGLELLLAGLRHAPPVPSIVPIRVLQPSKGTEAMESPGSRPGYRFPSLLTKLQRDGRLGKSAGQGLFRYVNGKAEEDHASYYLCVSKERECGVAHLDEEGIRRRLLYAVFNGCLWALHLGVATPEALDVGMREILQMKQGPITMMRQIGRQEVLRSFRELATRWGRRFELSGMEHLVP